MNVSVSDDIALHINHLLRARRTVHEFQQEPVPRALLHEALDAARWAPNHHRTEPWRVYLLGIEAQQAIATLNAENVRAARGDRAAEVKLARWSEMPGWLVMTAPHNDDRLRQQEDYAACCCAAQNFMLSFWSRGVGVKWTTGAVVRQPEFADIVGFSATDEYVVGLFWYGWPARVGDQHRAAVDTFVVEVD